MPPWCGSDPDRSRDDGPLHPSAFDGAALAARRLATYRAVADQFDEASPVTAIGSWEVRAGLPGVLEVS